MDTLEIRKGDFVYRDTLFVDLGSNKRHPRASPSDLKDLLLPRSGSPPKDKVAHWYEAQLIHYGLQRSKDKNTAKVRLTNAITSKALAVPKEVVAMEADMMREFASALRKGNNGATKAQGEKVATSKAKKSTSKTIVELEIDGMKLKIDREAIDAAKKNTTKSKGATQKPKGAKASPAAPKAAAAPKSSPVKAATAKSRPVKPTSSAPTPRPLHKQTSRRGQPFPRSTSGRPTPSPSQTYDHTPHSFRHEVEMEDAPPSYDSIDFSHNEEPSDSRPVQISGTYFFPRPPVQPFDLTLQIDQRSQKLWGHFQVGKKEGVLRMDDISRITSGDALSFGWRSEDQNDGFVKFGRGCDGTMSFDGEGWVNGRFRGLLYGEDVEFEANLVNEDGLDVAKAKHIWDDFPRKAYGRA